MTDAKVLLNGEDHELRSGTTVEALLISLGLASRRVAVEVNRRVIEREAWAGTEIADGDEIEVVQFVGGGC